MIDRIETFLNAEEKEELRRSYGRLRNERYGKWFEKFGRIHETDDAKLKKKFTTMYFPRSDFIEVAAVGPEMELAREGSRLVGIDNSDRHLRSVEEWKAWCEARMEKEEKELLEAKSYRDPWFYINALCQCSYVYESYRYFVELREKGAKNLTDEIAIQKDPEPAVENLMSYVIQGIEESDEERDAGYRVVIAPKYLGAADFLLSIGQPTEAWDYYSTFERLWTGPRSKNQKKQNYDKKMILQRDLVAGYVREFHAMQTATNDEERHRAAARTILWDLKFQAEKWRHPYAGRHSLNNSPIRSIGVFILSDIDRDLARELASLFLPSLAFYFPLAAAKCRDEGWFLKLPV